MMQTSKSQVIKVSIVEDDDRVRESLTVLIEGTTGLCCVSSHKSGEDALKLIPVARPEVVLMDINLPQMTGIECVRRLKAIEPTLQILMLTAYEDDELIFQALTVGAHGYLLKQTPPGELLEAIVQVHCGGGPMSSNIARKVIESFHQAAPAAPATEYLSKREREILKYLAKGFLYKEIAEALSLGYETVHTHIGSIYNKLHVRSRAEAVAKFFRT